MKKNIRILIIIVVVGIIAGVAALMWPRPCTPDEKCIDYVNLNNALNGNVNTNNAVNSNVNNAVNTNVNLIP